MEFFQVIKQRHSTRSYKSDPVARADIETILDAGRLSPTAKNIQPRLFMVITDAANRERLAEIVGPAGPFIATAPVCIIVFGRTAITDYWLEDGCAATQSMHLAAGALGLGSCWVGGHGTSYAPRVCQFLEASDELALVSIIAVGYEAGRGEPASKTPLDQITVWEVF